MNKIDEVVKVISPEQVSERIAERNVDVAVAQIMGETTDMIQSAHQERTPGRTVEDIIDVNVSQEMEETGEVVPLTSQVRKLVLGRRIQECIAEEIFDVSATRLTGNIIESVKIKSE